MGPRIFEYFVVCGVGPEIRTLDGNKGFHGTGVMYLSSLLDHIPKGKETRTRCPKNGKKKKKRESKECVLPAGVEFYASGFDSNDASTFPRSYPIVLTDLCGKHPYYDNEQLQLEASIFWRHSQKASLVNLSPRKSIKN
ncbi:hypothetical protein RJ640_010866 [Escallonia rubra]|uniref:Uncharacterized protein n=1 Tax=Escallonia rubra TaxID=112253 RepID=A0AA88RLB0_9ASTE|nr:hypothetical protein RJ640_010866 [Escallonia rubra]